jgi:CarD family transcriptional regulator
MRRKRRLVDWSRRYKVNLEKLGSGDPDKVAEVIADPASRELTTGISAGERRMLERARRSHGLL